LQDRKEGTQEKQEDIFNLVPKFVLGTFCNDSIETIEQAVRIDKGTLKVLSRKKSLMKPFQGISFFCVYQRSR